MGSPCPAVVAAGIKRRTSGRGQVEFLDAVVFSVHHEDGAAGAEGQGGGPVELPLLVSRIAPLPLEPQVRPENLCAVFAVVGHEEVVLGIELQALGMFELPGCGYPYAEHREELAGPIEPFDPVVVEVGDEDLAGLVDVDAHRPIELPVAPAQASPLKEIIPARVELLNPVVPLVRHVDPVPVDGDVVGLVKLAVALARSAPLRKESPRG